MPSNTSRTTTGPSAASAGLGVTGVDRRPLTWPTSTAIPWWTSTSTRCRRRRHVFVCREYRPLRSVSRGMPSPTSATAPGSITSPRAWITTCRGSRLMDAPSGCSCNRARSRERSRNPTWRRRTSRASTSRPSTAFRTPAPSRSPAPERWRRRRCPSGRISRPASTQIRRGSGSSASTRGFWLDPAARSATIHESDGGIDYAITATPVSAGWSFGDGAVAELAGPQGYGRPYPQQSPVTHVFEAHDERGYVVKASVRYSVTWTASIGGQSEGPYPMGTLVQAAIPLGYPVEQAQPELLRI
jgi:hypothetical protein